ncbi:N-acetylneuraminate synthase family protein [Candidatus Pelagibacter sp.]|nr:N-acetylneuraminate synthase family protein [Candidatus Pelagibacter sp.]
MKNNNIKKLFNNQLKETYLIAEIGNNHNGSIELAKKMILSAKKNGANCVKFQTFTQKSLFTKKFLDKNLSLKKDVEKFTLELNDFKLLKNFADKNNIDFAATPFSKQESDYLIYKLKVKFIKIASMDINNHPLIEYLSKKKIPIILSTGFGNKKEIFSAINILKKNKTKYIVLHCVSEYPPKNKDLNLNRIVHLKNILKVPIGFSDHTIGTDIPFAAISLGVKVLEKHFTLNKKMKGWDHSISINPEELKKISDFKKKINQAMGINHIYRVETIQNTNAFRRSVVAAKIINKGKKISFSDLDFKRPGNGLPPTEWKKLVGKRAKKKIKFDEKIFLKNIQL